MYDGEYIVSVPVLAGCQCYRKLLLSLVQLVAVSAFFAITDAIFCQKKETRPLHTQLLLEVLRSVHSMRLR